MATIRGPVAKFRVGDLVEFRYGTYDTLALVREDRGPLGGRGRRLYTVRMLPGNDPENDLEVLEDALRPAPHPGPEATRS